MSETFDYSTYLSPFTWRYGSREMRKLWSQHHKRTLWRQIWVAVARAQVPAGLVTPGQVSDLAAHADTGSIDMETAHRLEQELQHDLMAEVHTFAAQCTVGGSVIHLGCTSMDIEDNADALRLRDALDLILEKVDALVTRLAARVLETADDATMGFTHLQPAEPTTTGYRLAQYLQDLMADRAQLLAARHQIKGKGFKGASGTSASYVELFGSIDGAHDFETAVLDDLGLNAFDVTTQTYPRKQDFSVLSALASVAQTLYRFAFDLRVLQSPSIGEWREPFGSKQIGSSAMPFKRNPINAENIGSLARLVAGLPRVAWDNAAHSLLERTLDDSANRRSVLPQGFLATDEILKRAFRLVDGMTIDRAASQRLLDTYGTFAATERVLMEAVKAGGDRQLVHEVIREHSMAAWPQVQAGHPNPLFELLAADPMITEHVAASRLPELLDARHYVGDAAFRAKRLAQSVLSTVDATSLSQGDRA